MDNFHIDLTCEGRATLSAAVGICFTQHRAATHYAVRGPDAALTDQQYAHQNRPAKPRRLVFMWTSGGAEAVALPFSLDAEGVTDFAMRWLAEQDLGREPDHDGDNGRGWRLYNEGWGHVDGEYHGWIAVSPAWAMDGK